MKRRTFVSIRNLNRKILIPLTRIKSERLFSKAGFSLLEFTIALVIISALVSLLIPKLNRLQDNAHQASVQLTANSLQSAVNLTHSLWQSQGSENKPALLKGYGRGNILMGNKGWPIDAIAVNSASVESSSEVSIRFVLNSSTCKRLWNGLLKETAPYVEIISARSLEDEKIKSPTFLAEFDRGICRFRYQLDISRMRIDYDLATGRVITLF